MHKFLRTIGFSDFKKKDLEIILDEIIKRPDRVKVTNDSEGNLFAEYSLEVAPGVGIRVCGTYTDEEEEDFKMDYFFPYYESDTLTTKEETEVIKHAEKETYAGISDEVHLGVTLIFYVTNVADHLCEKKHMDRSLYYGVNLAGLCSEGKILLPIEKKPQYDKQGYGRKNRNQLVSKAREGDEEAIENLTIEDMDTYSLISKRVMYEDILSIVSTYFMPYGIESDQYSIMGDILEVESKVNEITQEKIYLLKINCNELVFHICINEKDLLGEPMIGRRFKGNLWLQGTVCTE